MGFKKFAAISMAGICISAASLCGCAGRGRTIDQYNTPVPQQQGLNGQNLGAGMTTPVPGQRLSTTPMGGTNPLDLQRLPQNMQNNRQQSENIKNQVEGMAEVDKASCSVVGNNAVVGYTPSNPSQDVNATKNMIIDKVKQLDNNITNVTVSESPEVMDRIGRIFNDMGSNRPADEISEEFNQLIRSITPASH